MNTIKKNYEKKISIGRGNENQRLHGNKLPKKQPHIQKMWRLQKRRMQPTLRRPPRRTLQHNLRNSNNAIQQLHTRILHRPILLGKRIQSQKRTKRTPKNNLKTKRTPQKNNNPRQRRHTNTKPNTTRQRRPNISLWQNRILHFHRNKKTSTRPSHLPNHKKRKQN